MDQSPMPQAAIFDGLNVGSITEIVQMIPGSDSGQPDIECGTTPLQESSDGRILTGVWRCEPCDWAPMEMGDHRGEFFQVLEGSMVIQEEGREPIEAGPGFSVYTPPGWKGRWRVPSTLRKAFVSFQIDNS
jgi:uncharacterized cupin superfamily protein